MGPFILAGIAAFSSSGPQVNVESKWNDDVGAPLQKKAAEACADVQASVEACQKALGKVEKLKPVEFRSEAENINRIIQELERMRMELART